MTLSYLSIVRLGLVQMALGSIVVLTTSTLNRLMIVELAMAAVIPGLLVAFHYGIQITRPNWGFRSDRGGSRTPWIIGGMATLAVGGILAAAGVIVMEDRYTLGLVISILAYALIGLGVGASGTSLLALLAKATDPRRRAAAATITWLMMIAGIAITAGVVGSLLDPYSPTLLLTLVSAVAGLAVAVTCLATWGIERRAAAVLTRPSAPSEAQVRFIDGFVEIWAERKARHFTIFVFLSMTAYFMQELILEPYAGIVFQMTPGQSTSLSGAQNGGVFIGMLTVGIAATGLGLGSLRTWVIAGCFGSSAALIAIAALGQMPEPNATWLQGAVIALGFANGIFAVAAIGAMMRLAGEGRAQREGTRMGLWGAAQAIAAGFGGLVGAAGADIMRVLIGQDAPAFATVFTLEAALFVASAVMAASIMSARYQQQSETALVPGE
ncbi:MAG: BCD family MFS transporter [Pseudomonadota bacterium]